ncbi:MAG: hypothetical protein OEO79_18430 [Gemmatimonadota bacterium]|nr:hypothetical protein [Gemmatimonadota bacterium]
MNARMWALMTVLLALQGPLSAPLSAQLRSGGPGDQRPVHTHVLYFSPGEGVQQSTVELRRDRVRGALWGGGIGLFAGGILGGLTVGSVEGDDGFGGSLVEASATGEAVVLGALVGAVIGVVLGSTAFAPRHAEDDGRPVVGGSSASPIISHGAIGLAVRFHR